MDPLGVVGGWFGIRALQELLKPEYERRYDRWKRQQGNSDDITFSPRALSMMALEELLNSSAVRERLLPGGAQTNPAVVALADLGLALGRGRGRLVPRGAEGDLAVRLLNDWIRLHKADLEKLPQIGEGVDFSPRACKGGKPVNR